MSLYHSLLQTCDYRCSLSDSTRCLYDLFIIASQVRNKKRIKFILPNVKALFCKPS